MSGGGWSTARPRRRMGRLRRPERDRTAALRPLHRADCSATITQARPAVNDAGIELSPRNSSPPTRTSPEAVSEHAKAPPRVSAMAQELAGSLLLLLRGRGRGRGGARERAGSLILAIGAEVRAMAASGKPLCNLTVGDFNPIEFAIPRSLLAGVTAALEAGQTNYPPSDGVEPLRRAVGDFYARRFGNTYLLPSV